MRSRKKIILTVISVIALSFLLGFVYDALMTASEKKSFPQKYTV